MQFISLWKISVIAVLILVVQCIIRNLLFRPKNIPGPFLARFTRLWLFLNYAKSDFEKTNIFLHQKYADKRKKGSENELSTPHYAPVVRVGPNLYSLSQAPKNVYGVTSKMEKSDWYDGFVNPLDPVRNSFTLSDVPQHAALRKKMQNVYSLSSILSYETYVDRCEKIFLERLNEMATKQYHEANDGGYIDFGHWLQCYAFDVIAEITFSKRLGFLDAGQDVNGLIKTVDRQVQYGILMGLYMRINPFVFRLLQYLPASSAHGLPKLFEFITKSQSQRKAQRKSDQVQTDPEVPQDVLDKLLDNQMDEKRGITDSDVFGAMLGNIGAGSDTTSSSLSAIIYQLIKNPACLAKLRREITDATTAGLCDEHRVSFKATQEMPYLQAVIKEGLRMHTAVGLPMWRVVGAGGTEVLGHWLPEGSEIGVNPWVAHYNQEVWGDDVYRFRPERWIEAQADREKLKLMEANYFPFGLGSRTCLGRHISSLEMSKVVPQIVRNFDLELKYPDRSWTYHNSWIVKPQDFLVKIKAIGSKG